MLRLRGLRVDIAIKVRHYIKGTSIKSILPVLA